MSALLSTDVSSRGNRESDVEAREYICSATAIHTRCFSCSQPPRTMLLTTTSLVFDCPPARSDPSGSVLKMTANRYFTPESASNAEGFSLLFAHCIGSHKEQWEPIIQQVFQLQQSKARHQRVREAWAFDWQNHGDAAILNREVLLRTRLMGVSAHEWADGISAFVRSPRMLGKRIIAIGHSAGGGAMLNSLKSFSIPVIPFASVILLEPTIATPEMFYEHMADSVPANVAATTMRQERWRSRGDAFEWFKRRAPWRAWDARVLCIFIENGLADTPDGEVVLKCDRRQEAMAFPDVQPHFDAVEELARVCQAVPVHLVWANRSHLMSRVLQDSLADVSEGRRIASITRLDGGHMIVQEQPDRVAFAICSTLDRVGVDFGTRARSRL
ncbi:Alpha/beta hydrolase family-domain-containing protein [Mycena latifolia]|nr:Alpha/beta hydrolase family-domain-containing protein [Mycena latifolia]